MNPQYDKRTGALLPEGANPDYSGVKDQSMLKFNDTTGQPITLDQLKTKETPVVTPPNTPPATPTPITLSGATSPEAQAEIDKIKAQKETEVGGITGIMKELGIEQGKEAQFATEAGADIAQKKYTEFANQLASEQRALELRKRELLSSGGFESQAQAQNAFQAEESKSLQRQADIAILGNAAKGDFDTAMAIAKRKVESAVAPLKAELEAKKFIFENNKDLFSKAESAKLNILLTQEENRIEREEKDKTLSNEMFVNALQGRAPQSLISKAQDIINKGGSSNEVAKALGNYSMSVSDRLDLDIKRLQKQKLNNELITPNKDAGELVKIQGKEYIRYKDGTISEPILPESVDTSTVVSRLNEKINTVDNIISNKDAIAFSAGALRGKIIPPGYINKVNDWKANAGNILNKLTVDELGRVKTDGVTFGQLSNGEREAVGNATTALNQAQIYSGSGDDKKATGRFKMSEPELIRQFEIINNAYKLDFERRVGIPFEQYKANPDIIKNKTADDFIDSATGAIKINNNYGGYPTN